MTEFTKGIGTIFKTSSLALAIVYTLGHILIAMTVISVMTDASLRCLVLCTTQTMDEV